MEGGTHEAWNMPDARLGGLSQELDEAALIRRIDGEDIETVIGRSPVEIVSTAAKVVLSVLLGAGAGSRSNGRINLRANHKSERSEQSVDPPWHGR